VRDRAVGQFVVVAVCKSVLAGGKGWHVGQSLKMLLNDFIGFARKTSPFRAGM
jgi:hypothetical protein